MDDLNPDDFGAAEQRRHPSEILSSATGRDAAEVAAVDRCLAGMREMAVARFRFEVAVRECTSALSSFMRAWRASEERLSAEEALAVAAHPDLAELNVTLDGFYADQ